MLKDITLGQYFPGNSPLHRMDARTKLIMAVLYLVVVFLIGNFTGYALLALFTFFYVTLSGVPWRMVLKSVKPLMFFILLTAVLNIFLTDGNVLWQWGFLKVTEEGLRYAAFMILRIFFLVIGTSMLTYTTSPIDLTDGMEILLRPLSKIGFPAHELAMIMSIALRFIPILLEETDKIMKAQMARGADFESGNLMQRARALIPLLVPLFISAFRRSDELATAMEARCYRGGEGRTRMRISRFARVDLLGSIVFLLFGAAIIVISRWEGLL